MYVRLVKGHWPDFDEFPICSCAGHGVRMIQRLEASCAVGDGILLLHDPTANVERPPSSGTESVAATESCVCIRTVRSMAGPVTVVLTDSSQDYDGGPIFRGKVETPGRRLAFVTSDGNPVLQAQVKDTATFVMILADNREYPSKLVCVVEGDSFDAEDALDIIGRFGPALSEANPDWHNSATKQLVDQRR